MLQRKINPVIQWWVTPKLPYEDIYGLPLLRDKSLLAKFSHIFSQWFIHPIKRRLARWYLKLLQKFTSIKVIAVTGSAGKTTTIQMLSSVLKLDGKTVSPKEGIDSVYNIPNTILKTPWRTKYLILEMSIEYVNEMDFYLWLVKPDIAVITNIFPTHTLYFGSAGGVAKEKSKLITALSEDGVAVLNRTNTFTQQMSEVTKAKVVWFDEKQNAQDSNKEIVTKVAESFAIDSQTIKKGIAHYIKPKHRYNVFKNKSGALVFDDSYNSNPEACLTALRDFVRTAGNRQKVAVIGDMLELGKISDAQHKRVGRKLNEYAFVAVIGVGKLSKAIINEIDTKKTQTWLVENTGQVFSLLTPFINNKTAIFIKGSRSIGLDKLVPDLS